MNDDEGEDQGHDQPHTIQDDNEYIYEPTTRGGLRYDNNKRSGHAMPDTSRPSGAGEGKATSTGRAKRVAVHLGGAGESKAMSSIKKRERQTLPDTSRPRGAGEGRVSSLKRSGDARPDPAV